MTPEHLDLLEGQVLQTGAIVRTMALSDLLLHARHAEPSTRRSQVCRLASALRRFQDEVQRVVVEDPNGEVARVLMS